MKTVNIVNLQNPALNAETFLQNFIQGLDSEKRVVFAVYSPESGQTCPVPSTDFAELIRAWVNRIVTLPDPILPIFGRMTPNLLAAYIGVMLAGKLPAFISYPNFKISPEDYRVKLQNYQNQFRNTHFIGEQIDALTTPNTITPDELTSSNSIKWLANRDPDAPLFLQCSSGSTGLQKSVSITTRQIVAQIEYYSRAIQFSSDDLIVSWLPLYHDMGLMATFFLPLFKQASVIYIDPFDWVVNPGIQLELIEKHHGTLTWLPNFAFSFLCKVPARYDLSSMRSFINCSEPVTRGAFEKFAAHHRVQPAKFSVCYALAENVYAATQTSIGAPPSYLMIDQLVYQQNKIQILEESVITSSTVNPAVSSGKITISCGSAIEGTRVKIDCGAGEDVGEIMLSGDCTISGYFRATPSAENGWFRTGDLGFLHDNQLYISGRLKDLIINQGKNLYPQDIEEVANSFDLVHNGRVVALGYYNEELESEQALLLFEPDRPLELAQKEQLCSRMKRRIDSIFDISSQVVAVPRMWLRKTSSGKIARRSNLEKYLACKDRHFWVVGDSHVRLLWTSDRSYVDTLKNVHARWVGVFWSDDLHKFDEKVLEIISGCENKIS